MQWLSENTFVYARSMSVGAKEADEQAEIERKSENSHTISFCVSGDEGSCRQCQRS